MYIYIYESMHLNNEDKCPPLNKTVRRYTEINIARKIRYA